MSLRLGTRASKLAQWQAEWVAAQLQRLGVEVELTPITTAGDRRGESLGVIGGQGVFTKEIQLALLDGRVDLAVHSLKDLPTLTVPGLCLAAVPCRASYRDALVANAAASFEKLPAGAIVGTGSARRWAQLLRARPDLTVKDIRGNLDTRLRKLRAGEFDALVLAEAGLTRLGLESQITEVLSLDVLLPAPGQGALGLETRAEDAATRQIVAQLDDAATHAAVLAERQMLASLQAGCTTPVAALGVIEGERLTLTGRVLQNDGRQMIESQDSAAVGEAQALGCRVADDLLRQGAAALLAAK